MLPGWNQADKTLYLSSCIIDQLRVEEPDYDFSIGYCICAQKNIENLYSVEELVSVPESSYINISEECKSDYSSYIPDWNKTAVTQFMYGCFKDISDKGYAHQIASRYCGCTLSLLKANFTFDEIDQQNVESSDLIELSDYCEDAFISYEPLSESITDQEYEVFISSCIEKESQGIDIDIVSSFCNCLLENMLVLDSRFIDKDSIEKIRYDCKSVFNHGR